MKARILHIVTNLELGGAQSSVVDICARLLQRGYDVHLAYSSRGGRTPGADRTLRDRARDAGISLHDVRFMHRSINPMLEIAAFASLLSLIRRLRPHVVHTHMSKAGLLGRVAAMSLQVPGIVHSVRGWSFYAVRSPVLRHASILCERLAARRTHAMLAVSEAALHDGVSRYIGSASAYQLVRSGLDLDRFAGSRRRRAQARALLGVGDHVKLVGGVMVFSPPKAPLDFVEVARQVCAQRDDVHFALVGYGAMAGAVDTAVANHGIRNRLHLLGLRSDVERVYPAFDALLCTSHWEGLPRVIVEAIASGVPVVSTAVGGCQEVVIPGQTGLLAERGDVETLAAHLLTMLSSDALAAAVREHGARVAGPFEIGEVVAQHDELYRRLLDG